MKKQTDKLWKIIDALKKAEVGKNELIKMLEVNDQDVPKGIDRVCFY